MRTQVECYDLDGPSSSITWREGYRSLLALVRDGRRPLGLVRIERAASAPDVVPTDRLKREIRRQLDFLPECERGDPAPRELPPPPPISVVVCTRDRPDQLARCLRGLAALDYGPHEIIVVDSASRDAATERVVRGTPFRYVREDRAGLDRARNRGMAEARHEIIAYVDDDVVVDPCWLRGLADGFADRQVAAVTGLVLPLELETEAQHLFEAYGGGMNRGMRPRRFQRERMSSRQIIETQQLGVGANMAFRRDVLERLGGFDTALDPGTPAAGAGDLDMFHRVITAGLILRYEPAALVWHRHRPGMEGLRRQLFDNGRSFGVYLIKIYRRGSVRRGAVMYHAAVRWGGWLTGRIVKRLLGRHRLPSGLLWAELRGALGSPAAYRATYRRDGR